MATAPEKRANVMDNFIEGHQKKGGAAAMIPLSRN